MANQLKKISIDKLYFDSSETEMSFEVHGILDNLAQINKNITDREEAGLFTKTDYNFYNAQLDEVKDRIDKITVIPLIKFLKKNGWFVSINHHKFNNN